VRPLCLRVDAGLRCRRQHALLLLLLLFVFHRGAILWYSCVEAICVDWCYLCWSYCILSLLYTWSSLFPRYMAGRHRKPIKNRQKLRLGKKYEAEGLWTGKQHIETVMGTNDAVACVTQMVMERKSMRAWRMTTNIWSLKLLTDAKKNYDGWLLWSDHCWSKDTFDRWLLIC